MATAAYTALQLRAGFVGLYTTGFGTPVTSQAISQQDWHLCWHGSFVGTQIELMFSSANGMYITIDGGSETLVNPGASGFQVAATGLSDATHTIKVRIPSNGYIPRPDQSSNWVRVTGAAPTATTTRQSEYLSAGIASGYCKVIGRKAAVVNISSYETVEAYGKVVSNNGWVCIRRRMTGTKLYIYLQPSYYESTYEADIRIYNGRELIATVDMTTALTQSRWAELEVDLTSTSANNTLSEIKILFSSAVLVAGIGVAGTLEAAAPPVRKIVYGVGDSIVAGFQSSGNSWGDLDTLSGRLNFDYLRTGIGGEAIQNSGASGGMLSSQYTRVTSAENASSPDIIVITHGVNDGITSSSNTTARNAFKSAYTTIITNLLAAFPSAIIVCRGMVPNVNSSGSTYWTVNTLVSEVVSEYANANVRFLDMTGLSGVDTVDGLHPNNTGYIELADYEESYFKALTWSWQNMSGETSSSLAITGTTADDSGRAFRCVATNTAGSANSDSATLTVT